LAFIFPNVHPKIALNWSTVTEFYIPVFEPVIASVRILGIYFKTYSPKRLVVSDCTEAVVIKSLKDGGGVSKLY